MSSRGRFGGVVGKPWRDYCQLVEGMFFGVLGAASGGRVGVPKIRRI